MPYIPENARGSAAANPLNKAELTYALTKLIHNYVEYHGQNFNTMSDTLAAVECAKLEFYRTVVGPYEDRKRASNGSISTLDKTGPEVLKMAEEAFKLDSGVDAPAFDPKSPRGFTGPGARSPEPYPYSPSPRHDGERLS